MMPRSFFARIPLLGTAFASETLELALLLGDDATAKRCLAVLADPAGKGADSRMKNFRQLTPMEVARSADILKIIQNRR